MRQRLPGPDDGSTLSPEFMLRPANLSPVIRPRAPATPGDDSRAARKTIRKFAGKKPVGWMSPWLSQSRQTLDLLQEAGYVYQCDWPLDDQPIWMRTRGGKILNMPYPLETNDSPTMLMRLHTAAELSTIWIDQFDEMLDQSRKGQSLVCPFVLHTFILGQPFRLRQLRRAMQHILRHRDEIWLTQPGEIAAHVEKLPAGTVPGS
jgi:allantoinase